MKFHTDEEKVPSEHFYCRRQSDMTLHDQFNTRNP